MLPDLAPNGQSYILAVNEYCQRHFHSDALYVFSKHEPSGYSVTAILDGLTYATEVSPNKFVAKIMAARSTAEALLPELRCEKHDKRLPEALQLPIFDNVDLADERIPQITMPHETIKPYRILLQCLDRNFGYKEKDIEFMTYAGSPFSNGRLTMSVGSYSVSVAMSRFAKQEASQTILVNVHPHLESWGSLVRMYVVNEAQGFSTMSYYLELAQNVEPSEEPELANDVVPQEAAREDKGEPRTAFRGVPESAEESEDDDDDDDEEEESSAESSDEEEPISILYGADYKDELDELEALVAKDVAPPPREVNCCTTPLYRAPARGHDTARTATEPLQLDGLDGLAALGATPDSGARGGRLLMTVHRASGQGAASAASPRTSSPSSPYRWGSAVPALWEPFPWPHSSLPRPSPPATGDDARPQAAGRVLMPVGTLASLSHLRPPPPSADSATVAVPSAASVASTTLRHQPAAWSPANLSRSRPPPHTKEQAEGQRTAAETGRPSGSVHDLLVHAHVHPRQSIESERADDSVLVGLMKYLEIK